MIFSVIQIETQPDSESLHCPLSFSWAGALLVLPNAVSVSIGRNASLLVSICLSLLRYAYVLILCLAGLSIHCQDVSLCGIVLFLSVSPFPPSLFSLHPLAPSRWLLLESSTCFSAVALYIVSLGQLVHLPDSPRLTCEA